MLNRVSHLVHGPIDPSVLHLLARKDANVQVDICVLLMKRVVDAQNVKNVARKVCNCNLSILMLKFLCFTGNCGAHEELSPCANPCQASFSWKNRPACPTFTCSEGCVCKENYYRATNGTDSPCIAC